MLWFGIRLGLLRTFAGMLKSFTPETFAIFRKGSPRKVNTLLGPLSLYRRCSRKPSHQKLSPNASNDIPASWPPSLPAPHGARHRSPLAPLRLRTQPPNGAMHARMTRESLWLTPCIIRPPPGTAGREDPRWAETRLCRVNAEGWQSVNVHVSFRGVCALPPGRMHARILSMETNKAGKRLAKQIMAQPGRGEPEQTGLTSSMAKGHVFPFAVKM